MIRTIKLINLILFVFIFFEIVAGNVAANNSHWAEIKSNDPWGTKGSAFMAFDSSRNHLIMLIAGDNRTWALEKKTWIVVHEDSPRAANIMGLAFDEYRGVTVLLCHTLDQKQGEQPRTWEWNGTTWIDRKTQIAPPYRSLSLMAYDPVSQKVILFGGSTYDYYARQEIYYDETWAWDGQEWRQQFPANSPSPRIYHGMASDIGNNRLVLFGGYGKHRETNEITAFNDTWIWDGADWTQLITENTPSARHEFGMTYDPHFNRIVIHGGSDAPSEGFDETWVLVDDKWIRLAESTEAGARWLPALGFNGKKIVMYGGNSVYETSLRPKSIFPSQRFRAPLGDTLELKGKNWIRFADSSWSGGYYHVSMAYDSARQIVVIFGDQKIAEYDGCNWRKKIDYRFGKWPLNTHYTSFVFDDHRNIIVIFGGYGGGAYKKELWEWNGKKMIKVNPVNQPPEARAYSGAVFASQEGVMVVFGGRNFNTIFDETWLYDGASHSWEKLDIPGPEARYRTAMAYDNKNNQVILYGGRNVSGTLEDTWIFDLTLRTWSQRTPNSNPGPRQLHAMAYDPSRDKVILFGGISGVDEDGYYKADDRTWEWDGTTWVGTSSFGLSGRYFTTMAYDTKINGIVLFGGRTIFGTTLADLWYYKR